MSAGVDGAPEDTGDTRHIPVMMAEVLDALSPLDGALICDGTFGAGGYSVMSIDGEPVGHVRIERSVPVIFSISGETFDVGLDSGAAVGDYPHIYRFTGQIHGVTLERLSEPSAQVKELIADAEFRASLAVQ